MSRILEQLKEHLADGLKAESIEQAVVFRLIDEFADMEEKRYAMLRKDKKLTFGKYRGYTVKELALTEIGTTYCSWLLGQTWFVEKNSHLVDEIKELGIKAAKFKRTPLS